MIEQREPVPTDLEVQFYIGLHHICDAQHFERCMLSVNALSRRKSDFEVGEWIMDSGAFTEVSRHGTHRRTVEEYAAQIRRWSQCGDLLAAVSQDWMCEPFIIDRTGLSVEGHQTRTISRYDRLMEADTGDTYIMPVLQGYEPHEYVRHVHRYGQRFVEGAWVGVGSVCKRNSSVKAVEAVLSEIHSVRPDLRLHGFGLKKTALRSHLVRERLHSADSMAWSYRARKQGRDANDWREARQYLREIKSMPLQTSIFAKTGDQ